MIGNKTFFSSKVQSEGDSSAIFCYEICSESSCQMTRQNPKQSPTLLTFPTMYSTTDFATVNFMFYTQHQYIFRTNTVLSGYTVLYLQLLISRGPMMNCCCFVVHAPMAQQQLCQFPWDLNTGCSGDCAAPVTGITVT